MKNNIIIIISILFSVFSVHGQTYVQGDGVLAFRSIANTPALTDANRLNMNEAFQKCNEYIDSKILKPSTVNQMIGEYYFQDNLLIKLISINRNKDKEITEDGKEENLEETADYLLEMYTQNIYENEKYFVSHIIAKSNFKSLLYYDERDTYIRFTILDNAGKYRVMGSINFKPNNLNNARAFFDSFINSVTFK